MESRDASNSSIMSIGEMIDTAFGDVETNTVNHKLMQTVLYLLARQLRVLERRVAINLPQTLQISSSTPSITISEIKIHTSAKKKKFAKPGPRTADPLPGGIPGRPSDGGVDVTSSDGPTKGTISITRAGLRGGAGGGPPKRKTEQAGKGGAQTRDALGKGALHNYAKILDAIELERETELRVIHQRVDSREEHHKAPTPIASMDAVEATYEKLLIVERAGPDQAKVQGKTGTPQLSVVTQEQFQELVIKVQKIAEKFGLIGTATFPENSKLMEDLRRGASLTDAMAALQLSARLEAAEKAMDQMVNLVTTLASKIPGFDANATGEDTKILLGADKAQKMDQNVRKSRSEGTTLHESIVSVSPNVEARRTTIHAPTEPSDEAVVTDYLTRVELNDAMHELSNDMTKMVQQLLSKANINADLALKLVATLERKLESTVSLGTKMDQLEDKVADYSVQINDFDTGLTAQMTNYQEELTQMQHDLETALETMAEVLANTGGDSTAVSEMNAHFNNLQVDIEDTLMRQKELKTIQDKLQYDLQVLRKEIEILREVKADRDEVVDALRDKAGISALNGMVSLEQFYAIRIDFENRVVGAYDKFNSQESMWQKAIDDLVRELHEKADVVQVTTLKDDINKHLEALRNRLQFMLDIVGEPRAVALRKHIFRDAACLSCSTPAVMETEEKGIPLLPAVRSPKSGADTEKRKGSGDYKPCYPGQPITHPIDPRAKLCARWCGGSHTKINNNALPRIPPSTTVKQLLRNTLNVLGKDGKTYLGEQIQPEDPSPSTPKGYVPANAIVPAPKYDMQSAGYDITPPADFQSALESFTPDATDFPCPPSVDHGRSSAGYVALTMKDPTYHSQPTPDAKVGISAPTIDNATPPTDNDTPPTENATLPIENAAMPIEKGSTPIENGSTQIENNSPPIENATLPIENATPPIENAENSTPAADNVTPPLPVDND